MAEAGRVMRRPEGVDWIVVVVRRVVIRDCVPSRAISWRVVFREARGRESSEEV